MFGNPLHAQLVLQSQDKVSLTIPEFQLTAYLQPNNNLVVKYQTGTYVIAVEAKKPNFGGAYCFFHCPLCNKRMRKLYCLNNQYQCHKCANLSYYSQRLGPSQRSLHNAAKIKDLFFLLNLIHCEKTARLHHSTFQKKYINILNINFYG